MAEHPFPAPLILPAAGRLPVLLSVPHSGRAYHPALLALSRGGQSALERLSDPLVDRLVWRAIDVGAGAVVAQTPRAAIDCNRREDELDPRAVEGCGAASGARAANGLGLVPSRHGGEALWRRAISGDELEQRLDGAYRPYHAALAERLDQLCRVHGAALLIDCHSMPTRARGRPQLVIGDRHGSSAAPSLTALAAHIGRGCGFATQCNDPFAGGAIVARHGRPEQGLHAIQVEIDRAAYLTPDGARPGVGFDRVAVLFEALARRLGQALVDGIERAEAAE